MGSRHHIRTHTKHAQTPPTYGGIQQIDNGIMHIPHDRTVSRKAPNTGVPEHRSTPKARSRTIQVGMGGERGRSKVKGVSVVASSVAVTIGAAVLGQSNDAPGPGAYEHVTNADVGTTKQEQATRSYMFASGTTKGLELNPAYGKLDFMPDGVGALKTKNKGDKMFGGADRFDKPREVLAVDYDLPSAFDDALAKPTPAQDGKGMGGIEPRDAPVSVYSLRAFIVQSCSRRGRRRATPSMQRNMSGKAKTTVPTMAAMSMMAAYASIWSDAYMSRYCALLMMAIAASARGEMMSPP